MWLECVNDNSKLQRNLDTLQVASFYANSTAACNLIRRSLRNHLTGDTNKISFIRFDLSVTLIATQMTLRLERSGRVHFEVINRVISRKVWETVRKQKGPYHKTEFCISHPFYFYVPIIKIRALFWLRHTPPAMDMSQFTVKHKTCP